MHTGNRRHFSGKAFWLIPAIIIAMGVFLRVAVYLYNRCLWTDEVSVALNIIEKDFAQLALPLDYGQYAPPIFLWLLKLSALSFGWGEQAFRLVPLLSGVAAMFVLYKVLKKNMGVGAYWYPLLVFATSAFLVRYSTEVKQYTPDALVTLLLVWLAQRLNINNTSAQRFCIYWLAAGTVAIWSSMPSVFVLAGVGCYYGMVSLQSKDYKCLKLIAGIATLWVAQFAFYYYMLLYQQAHNDHLMRFHDYYFLQLPLQGSSGQNSGVLNNIASAIFSGHYFPAMAGKMLLGIGTVVCLAKYRVKAMLFILPVVLMAVASLLKTYSLIPRLTLSIMPLLLLLCGMGLQWLTQVKFTPARAIMAIILVCSAGFTRPWQVLEHNFREEEMTDALNYLATANVPAGNVFVYVGAANQYKYYTRYHPQKAKWATWANGAIVEPGANLSALEHMRGRVALLYSIPFDTYRESQRFQHDKRLVHKYETTGCTVFIFE